MKKIITYSLLAHINNRIDDKSNFENIFIPLVKRALSKMCANDQFKGDDISEIQKNVEELYALDMPLTILSKILSKIEQEINIKEEKIKFYKDKSFTLNKYVFDDYEEEVDRRTDRLQKLQNFYLDFTKVEQSNETSPATIFEFVELNKISLGKYIKKKYAAEHHDHSVEARFVNLISPIEEMYEVLQSVYIGSIISTYLEYQPGPLKSNVELVLDTNFIISLINLNTSTSTDNCQRLLTIGEKLGYKFTVLGITLIELDRLLKTRVDYFDQAFLAKQLDPEDIYNACERRKLTKTDLDRIRHNLTSEIGKFNISIVSNVEKFENLAKYSEEFEKLKEKRNTHFAALHDATCLEYVKAKRGRPIYEFERVSCWFVNNSSSRSHSFTNGLQPLIIKAEDLLNLLWLSSPMVKQTLNSDDFSRIGISRLVSATLDDSLPNSRTIRMLDENIQKYAKNSISDEDIVRVSKGIASRTIINLDKLNEAAEKDPSSFVEDLQVIANLEKKKEEDVKTLLNKLIKDLQNSRAQLTKEFSAIEIERNAHKNTIESAEDLIGQNKRLKKENIKLQNEQRKPARKRYIAAQIRKWRRRALLPLIFGGVIFLGSLLAIWYLNDWKFQVPTENYNSILLTGILWSLSFIFSGIFAKIYTDRMNESSTAAFERKINIPSELEELQDD